MYSNQVYQIGKRSINGFIGVYPLDRLPKYIGNSPKSFIVNTDTHNLPGKHWIAVSFERGGIVYVFDPFGCFYPQPLIAYLHRKPNRRVIYNRIMYQKPWERNCGQRCLAFLISRSPNHGYKQYINTRLSKNAILH
jgi:hypothetical protein